MTFASVVAALTFFILPSPTILYDADLSPTVTLPAGYFVMLADPTAPQGYLSVIYDDISGYVKTADVKAVDYTPVNKYETSVRFRCDNDGQPVNLRAAPEKTAAVIDTLNSGASGRCYGHIRGEALITGADTLWYYVSVGGKRGYCYYAHISVDPTPPNIIEKEEPPITETPVDAPPADEDAATPTAATIILIVALCVPVPFIMFYMFRKKKDDGSAP